VIFARLGRFLDDRAGSASLLSRGFRYVFPDHWTFLFGEIALYCFLILVGTGVYLTFFFEPSTAQVIYDGSYAPLQGQEVSEAYRSAVEISLDVKAGLLIRQTHHWAALVFVAAIVVHMLRIFFTGAFRRPRDLNWMVGLTLALMAMVEGFAGYSLPDDLLSGMGLAIGYSVLAAFPIIGGWLAQLVWGGEFPGGEEFISRLYAAHVFILPILIFGLIGLHLYMVVRHRHTQFAGPGRQERNVIGSPAFPGYVLRSGGLFFATAGVLFLIGGLIQINPVWQYGVYQPWLGTNGAQPDYYFGWLIGALRLMPNWEWTVSGYTLIPNPFWGGILYPMIVFSILFAWPALERRFSGDRAQHHLVQRPRDAPFRTGLGVAFLLQVTMVQIAGSADRLYVDFGVSYELQVWFWRIAAVVFPILGFFIARAICRRLQRSDAHPLRGWTGAPVARSADGGFEAAAPPGGGREGGSPPP
jgi:ubiquinol-cytochrome c reductase cytochrome b subunit